MSHTEALNQSKRDSSLNGISKATVRKSSYTQPSIFKDQPSLRVQFGVFGFSLKKKKNARAYKEKKLSCCEPEAAHPRGLSEVGRPELDSRLEHRIYVFATVVSGSTLALTKLYPIGTQEKRPED